MKKLSSTGFLCNFGNFARYWAKCDKIHNISRCQNSKSKYGKLGRNQKSVKYLSAFVSVLTESFTVQSKSNQQMWKFLLTGTIWISGTQPRLKVTVYLQNKRKIITPSVLCGACCCCIIKVNKCFVAESSKIFSQIWFSLVEQKSLSKSLENVKTG